MLQPAPIRWRDRALPRLPRREPGGTRPQAGPAAAAEFIVPQDGAEKQDCERNAAKRWLGKQARPSRAIGRSISATTSSLVSPSPPPSRRRRQFHPDLQADLPQNHRRVRQRRRTRRAPPDRHPARQALDLRLSLARQRAVARQAGISASIGSPSRFEMPAESEPTRTASSPISPSPPRPSPTSPPAAAPDRRSRTRPTTSSSPTDTTSSTISASARRPSPASS